MEQENPKRKSNDYNAVIQFRCTDEQKRKAEDNADIAGMDFANFGRTVMCDAPPKRRKNSGGLTSAEIEVFEHFLREGAAVRNNINQIAKHLNAGRSENAELVKTVLQLHEAFIMDALNKWGSE